MNQGPGNYQPNYYQNTTENYEDYYENEVGVYQGNCGDAPSLRVPDTRLYSEGFKDLVEVYARNSPPYYGPPLTTELPYRHPTTAAQPMEYYPEDVQGHYYGSSSAPNRHIPPTQTISNAYHSRHCNQYYPNEMPHSGQGAPYRHEPSCVNDVNYIQGTYEDVHQEKYVDNTEHAAAIPHAKLKTCAYHQNCVDCNMPSANGNLRGSEFNKDICLDYNRKRKYYGYANKMARSAAIKKYPITVKTPKYTTKNLIPNTIGKRPSALCLSVVTQPDPALVKRKSKTNQHIRRNSTQLEQFPASTCNPSNTYSAHKMHSQGDVKTHLSPDGFETFLDEYESNLGLNEAGGEQQNVEETRDEKLKEFAKFLKPRVPSSIRFKQEKLASLKPAKTLAPQLKLSLDKLLNRLQKCEKNDSIEQHSERSCKSEHTDEKCADNKAINVNKVNSFNYEVLTRKCSPKGESEGKDERPAVNSLPKRPVNSLLGSLESKRSGRVIRAMDDHCALDLHRSKSYIVDLIDRALSKELGTIPRDQTVHRDYTPHKAVTTISRHRQSNHKELCYEVTAALTDSIISNATAPTMHGTMHGTNQIVERSTSDGQIQRQIYSGDDTYIKQLKQLRWGHIRHIQHEARKLADLEEFLEKCGEIEY